MQDAASCLGILACGTLGNRKPGVRMGLMRKVQTFQELAGAPSVTANSNPYDRVDGKHELAAARAVIPRPSTPGIFVPDFGTSGDQLVEAVSDSHRPTRICRCEARPLTFFVVQNVQRANREEVILRKLPLCVVNESYRGSVSGDRRSGSDACKPGTRRTEVDGSTDQGVRLVNVIRLGRRQERSCFIEAVCPGDIGLLQIIVPAFEMTVVDRVDAAKDRIVVAL